MVMTGIHLLSLSFAELNDLLHDRGPHLAFRGRFLLRPLEEPLRTGHARRGGGGVDEEGGGLRCPRAAPPPPFRPPPLGPLQPVAFAPPCPGDAKGPPPHRSPTPPSPLDC